MTTETTALPKIIHGRTLGKALIDAGVIERGDCVRRIVIDAPLNGPVVMYVERYGNERVLDIATTLEGIEIREVGAE